MTQDDLTFEECLRLLETSTDRGVLVNAACNLARSEDPRALPSLTGFLRDDEFLVRLDDLQDPHIKTRGVSQIFMVLADHPRPEVAALCLTLGEDPVFLADNDRLTPLLAALARVRPMTEETARFMERTNGEGYFAFNVPLLVENGSTQALALFEAMIADREVPAPRRIDCLHNAVVPHRTDLRVLEAVVHLLEAPLEEPVYVGVVESVFDYKTKQWYGPAIGAPEPPPWTSAGDDVLELVLRLSDTVRSDALPDELPGRVAAVRTEVRSILAERHR